MSNIGKKYGIYFALLVVIVVVGAVFTFEDEVKNNEGRSLTEQDIQSLLYVVEEEKLARDVYLKMYEIHGTEIFARIAQSEQRHMDAVRNILEQYGLEDPTIKQREEVFSNPELQQLYNDLINRGSKSLEDALNVGIFIEKLDIEDLGKRVEETKNEDIEKVFKNLMKGSKNHLEAFERQLSMVNSTL